MEELREESFFEDFILQLTSLEQILTFQELLQVFLRELYLLADQTLKEVLHRDAPPPMKVHRGISRIRPSVHLLHLGAKTALDVTQKVLLAEPLFVKLPLAVAVLLTGIYLGLAL